MFVSFAERFFRNSRASVPIMTAAMLFPLVVISGGAIDFVAYERLRSQLQDSLDRGVLASASLNQTAQTGELLHSFVAPILGGTPYDLDFDETRYTNARTINASLSAEYDTTFLRLIGIDTLAASVKATAEERRSNVEISLLLDMSGSMRFGPNGWFPNNEKDMRITFLRPAAKGFVDTVLSEEASQYTTVSLVPYAGQVSLGKEIFDLVAGGRRRHSKSSCLDFLKDSDFTMGLPNFNSLDQTVHFTQSNHHNRLKVAERASTQPWWCPDDPHAAVAPSETDYVEGEGADRDRTSISLMSNDATYLKAQIDNYRLYDGTGTPIAMRWGLLLLDPAIQPLIAQAAKAPSIANAIGLDPQFANRPARFDDEDTMKFLVLMTDGAVSEQVRPRNKELQVQYYNDPSRNEVVMTASAARSATQKMCSLAKNHGVTIFTIGFDLDAHAAAEMEKCATSKSHFYRVNSLNIEDAFKSIASAIQQIKLIG